MLNFDAPTTLPIPIQQGANNPYEMSRSITRSGAGPAELLATSEKRPQR